MNGADLITGSVAGLGASGDGRIMGESDRGRSDEEVLGGWIRGKDVEDISEDPFESVEARIISSGDEVKVMGVTGGVE